MAIKSLIEQAMVDRAARAHNCQASSRHRINKGDLRLKVRNGRSWDHYCQSCAQKIIERDIAKLTALQILIVAEKCSETPSLELGSTA